MSAYAGPSCRRRQCAQPSDQRRDFNEYLPWYRDLGQFGHLGGHRVAGVFLRQARNDNDPVAAAQQADDAFALASRMADAIAGKIHKHGQCRPRDLEKMGFTRDEIAEAWALASALAAVDGADQ